MKRLFQHTKRPEKRERFRAEWESGEAEYYAEEAEEAYYADESDGKYYADESEGEYYAEEAYYADESDGGYYADESDEEYYEEFDEEYYADESEERYYAEESGGEYMIEESDEEYASEEFARGYYAGETAEEYRAEESDGEYYAEISDEEYSVAIADEYYAEKAADRVVAGEILYEDDDFYHVDYRGEQKEPSEKQKSSLWEKLRAMSAMDKMIAGMGAAVLILALATGIALVSFRLSRKQEPDFVSVGAQLKDIDVIGGKGLLAVANAQMARLEAASLEQEPEESEESKPPQEEEPEYSENNYSRQVSVEMNMTSIQKDLKVKFLNQKTGKLVANVPFSVTVKGPDGKTSIWSDDDMDGIIHKKDITPGTYQITMEKLTDEKYANYAVAAGSKSATVKKDISYDKVDVGNEVKTEAEVNSKKEDTVQHETVVESVLQDTVAWVESSSVPASYKEILKSQIADPLDSLKVAGILNKNFMRMSNASVTNPTTLSDLTTPPEPTDSSAPAAPSEPSNAPAPTIPSEPSSAPEPTVPPESSSAPVPAIPSESTSPLEPALSLKSIELSSTAILAYVANPLTLSVTVKGLGAAAAKVTAEYDDTVMTVTWGKDWKVEQDAATVSLELGFLKEGDATLTVKAGEGEGEVKAVCEVKVRRNPREDTQTPLKDKAGNALYVLENGTYRSAVYKDYYTHEKFYVNGGTKYTGWQTINGSVYYYTAEGQFVTGEQVIQGAKYTFAGDGKLMTGSGLMGIDVSKWNGTIDWNAVKNSGVGYVIIRCGYRGSSQGALIEDPKYTANIKGATAAGLKVGVYFFTQAVDEREAVEEASMVLELIKNYKISYPVFLDVEGSGGRGDAISKEVRTAVCKAFCETIQKSGYTAGIYANKTWLEKRMDAAALSAYKIWLAQYVQTPTYTGRYDLWQYRSTGKVTGISGDVDLNLSYLGY